jgi:hypothetical protein
MTETEWLACTNPEAMLRFLLGKVSVRKRRLFACACCRTVWHLLHKRARKAITVMEDVVDGMGTPEVLEEARAGLWSNARYYFIPRNGARATRQAAIAAADAVFSAVSPVADHPNVCWEMVAGARLGENEEQDPSAIGSELARLLHDIVGNPFHPGTLDPSWREWNEGLIPKMAQAISAERTFDHLPILADALEEAGCTDTALLEHCRGPGPHVRGCWVLDRILDKQ